MKSYDELVLLPTFEERFLYLKLTPSPIGQETFGSLRLLNQRLYSSKFWKEQVRPNILLRDLGCDLGIEGREIFEYPIIHHISPITADDILNQHPKLFDENNLITVSDRTHRAIHYGGKPHENEVSERRKGDTTLWKQY